MIQSPWAGVNQRYKPGSKVKGTITSTTDYGVYVELEPGVEGLIRVGTDAFPAQVGGVGDEIDVFVTELDETQRLIALGISQ